MKTITINNIEFNNFGSNNCTNGMEMISCYPMPNNIVQDVLEGKYPNVWLNPSASCTAEFFGLYGTKEQYDIVLKQQREAQISKRLLEKINYDFSLPKEEWEKAESEVRSNYKDWWEE